MSKTAVISTRVDPELKRNAEAVFQQLGLSTTQAITLFLHQVELQQGLPFQVKVPNAETRAAIEESRRGENLESFDTKEDFYKELDI